MSDFLTAQWENLDSHLILSHRFNKDEKNIYSHLFDKFNSYPGHIWLTSSGSSHSANQSLKLYALSKEAFLSSAKSVNEHFSLTAHDRWLICLPTYHVGGLSILARSYLSAANTFYLDKWDAKIFCDLISVRKIKVTSLVPAQIFDLVSQSLKAPPEIDFVIVGGEALSGNLYRKACDLGWPIYQTYGMTELCSQVATQEVRGGTSQSFKILKHITAKTDKDKNLLIKSKSLFTGFAQAFFNEKAILQRQVWSPAQLDQDGFWRTADRAQIEGDFLNPLGRDTGFVKINGIGVSTIKIENWLKQYFDFDILVALKKFEDSSVNVRSSKLVCFIEKKNDKADLVDVIKRWNQEKSSVEKIYEINFINHFDRTELGKIKRNSELATVEVVLV
jgi:O-succinylbenzoic acid--CoA ligase